MLIFLIINIEKEESVLENERALRLKQFTENQLKIDKPHYRIPLKNFPSSPNLTITNLRVDPVRFL